MNLKFECLVQHYNIRGIGFIANKMGIKGEIVCVCVCEILWNYLLGKHTSKLLQ